LLDELGTAPGQISRTDNKSISLQLYSRWDQTNIEDTTSAAASDKLTQAEFLYYDTKALFVQVLRLNPSWMQPPMSLKKIAELCATGKDRNLVPKGIKLVDMMQDLEKLKVIDPSDGYAFLVEEITTELQHLGNLREKVEKELKSLEQVYKTIKDHNEFLRGQLDTYKSYLQNVRLQQSSAQNQTVKKSVPVKFTHQKLEQEGVITYSNVPESRRANIYFQISQPTPGTYLISLYYKGRPQAILEMDLKLDDLLEKQQMGASDLDLEYVRMDISKTLAMLNKLFLKK
jgi:Ras GTPase-activating-like protein IQGAP2/3